MKGANAEKEETETNEKVEGEMEDEIQGEMENEKQETLETLGTLEVQETKKEEQQQDTKQYTKKEEGEEDSKLYETLNNPFQTKKRRRILPVRKLENELLHSDIFSKGDGVNSGTNSGNSVNITKKPDVNITKKCNIAETEAEIEEKAEAETKAKKPMDTIDLDLIDELEASTSVNSTKTGSTVCSKSQGASISSKSSKTTNASNSSNSVLFSPSFVSMFSSEEAVLKSRDEIVKSDNSIHEVFSNGLEVTIPSDEEIYVLVLGEVTERRNF